MTDAVKGVYFLVVMVAVGWYSAMMMRGLNTQLSSHFISSINEQLGNNPHMRRDLERYKEEARKQQEQQQQQQQRVKQLEEEARLIQEKLAELNKRDGKYVKMEMPDL